MSRHNLYIALIAIGYSLSLTYTGGHSHIAMIGACLLLLAATCMRVRSVIAGEPVTWGPVQNVLLAYFAYLIVLLYTTTLIENTLHFVWLFSTFAAIVLITVELGRSRWQFLYLLFALTGLASALWGISEFFVHGTQANGPIIDPNTWVTFINMFFFASLVLYLTAEDKKYRYFALASILLFSMASFSAFSRAGAVVFWAGLLFSVVFIARVPDVRRELVPIGLAVAVSFATVSLLADWEEAREGRETEFSLATGGFEHRVKQWGRTLLIYQDYPVFGSGLGTFKVHYPTVRTRDDLGTAGNFAHNDYVQLLTESGPVMLLFVGAFVFFLLYRLVIHGVRAWQGERAALEPLLLIVAMGAPLIHALLNFPLYQMQVQMLMGLLFARYLVVAGPGSQRHVTVKHPRFSRSAILVGVIVVGTMPVLDIVSADLVRNQDRLPVIHRIGDNYSMYRDTLVFLSVLRSNNWVNRYGVSTIFRSAFDKQSDPDARRSLGIAAVIECERAIELNPYNDGIRKNCAEFLIENPWLEKEEEVNITAEQLLRSGIDIYPVYFEMYMQLADYLRVVGRKDEAYRVLVDGALPWINLKHGEFFDGRHALSVRILHEAKKRGDTETLEVLLGRIENLSRLRG